MKVTLIIDHENGHAERYEVRGTGRFSLGLVAQVVKAAVAANEHEVEQLKAMAASMLPLWPILRDLLLGGKVEEERTP